MEVFSLAVSRPGAPGGESSELAKIHRARWDDRRHGEWRDAQHCRQKSAWTSARVQFAARTVSRCSSPACWSSPFGVAPIRGKTSAEKPRRATTLSKLSQCFDRSYALPDRSAGRSAVAQGLSRWAGHAKILSDELSSFSRKHRTTPAFRHESSV